jgi:hypothetical protein
MGFYEHMGVNLPWKKLPLPAADVSRFETAIGKASEGKLPPAPQS